MSSTDRPTFLRMAIAIGLLLVLAGPASADDEPEADSSRPRIGLVLSGGGARGAAHVGVLQVLEELRIPVDCIAGTSMGSIIGGLYSAGYSPESMKREFVEIDWADSFNDSPPRKNISYRRKQDDRQSLFRLELGIDRHGFDLPAGLVAGQKLNFILRRMSLHVRHVDDFDNLYVPYRAVAADLATGEPYVIGTGRLGDAMRASMSIPGVFTPLELDGHVLVDGGMAMNLPVEVAQSMCADRIIAVDVGTPPGALQERQTVFGVAQHSISVMSKRNVAEQKALLEPDDVLIVPDLSQVRTADFDKLLDAVARGVEAAQAATPELRRFSVSEEEYSRFLTRQRRTSGAAGAPAIIDKIEVTGLDRIDPRLVKARLKTQPGDPFDLDAVRADLGRVSRLGAFEQIDFKTRESEQENKLIIDLTEKSWGPGFIRMGMSLESDLEGTGEFKLLANYRRAHVNRFDAEWQTIAEVGDLDRVFSEFYQPLSFSGRWFVAPHLELKRDEQIVYLENGDREIIDSKQRAAGLDLGVNFYNYGEIRVGAVRGLLDADLDDATAPLSIEEDIGAWVASVTLDRLDNANFPESGSLAESKLFLSRDSMGASDEYDKLSLRYTGAGSFGRNTLIGSVEVGSDLGSDVPVYDEFTLGGFLRLGGLPRDRLRGDAFGLVSLGYYWQITELPPLLGGGVYAGSALQAGNVWDDLGDAKVDDLIGSASLFLGAETILGPAFLSYGRTDEGDDAYYLVLGRVFD